MSDLWKTAVLWRLLALVFLMARFAAAVVQAQEITKPALVPGTTSVLAIQTTDPEWKKFGTAQALAAALETGASGHYNGAVIELVNNLSPSTNALTSALVSFGKLAPGSTGNQIFGHYSLVENNSSAGVGVAAELTARNFCGDPDISLPPNLAIGTRSCITNGLQITSGGSYNSSLGVLISPEGGSTHYFNTGIYLRGFEQYGLVVEAPHGTGESAWFKGVVRGADNGFWSPTGLARLAGLDVIGNTALRGTLTAASLATSGTIAGAICATASGQILFERAATGCTVSLRALKQAVASLTDAEAFDDLHALNPVAFALKSDGKQRRLGFVAEDVRAAEPRCATYDSQGKLQGYEPNCVISILVKVAQVQEREIAELKRELHRR